MQLTEQQLAIALAVQSGQGNIAVDAGAGSGKTTTAVTIVSDYIAKTDSVLYCAFNTKIKKETERKFSVLRDRIGSSGYSNASAKTFNGIAYGALMKRKGINSSSIEMNEQKYLKLARLWCDEHMSHLLPDDRDLAAEMINNIIHYARVNTTYEVTGSRKIVVLTGKREDGSPHYVPLDAPYFFGNRNDVHILREIAWKYDIFGQLDKEEDEERLLRAIPELLAEGKAQMDQKYICTFTDQVYWMVIERWQVWKNKWVIVDEAQDLSPLFRALVDNCFDAYRGGRVLVIGDPQQAIYAFTGADNDGFGNSMRFWNIEKAFPLTISWRCPVKVAELARAWKTDFQSAPNAIEGVVGDTSEEALVRDAQPGDAIISRTRGPMIPIWQKLVANGKAAIIIGSDVSKAIIKVLEQVSKRGGFKFEELPVYLREYKDQKLTRMRKKDKPQDEIDRFLDQMEAVNGAVEAVQASSMDELIRKIKDIFAKNDEEIDESNAVMIMTGHASKGLEFNRVYILTPTLFPFNHPGQSPEQAIQEMNLRYVVQTRAMKELLHVRTKKETPKKEDPKPVIDDVVEGEIIDDSLPLLTTGAKALEAAIAELDAAVGKLLEAPIVTLSDSEPLRVEVTNPQYDEALVTGLIEACLDWRSGTGHPITMMNRLKELAKLAEDVKRSGDKSSQKTVDSVVRVV